MEKKQNDQPNIITTVQEGYYDAMGFGPRDHYTHNSVHITQEEINNGEWDDVELIKLKEDDFRSLHRDGQKIDGYKKPIYKQSAGRKKKRKRKTKRRKSKRRKSKRRKKRTKKRKSIKRRRKRRR